MANFGLDRVAGRLAEVHDKPDGAIWFRYRTQWGDVVDREGGGVGKGQLCALVLSLS